MSSYPSAPPSILVETVPNARIRGLVTLFLRVGMGLYLLNTGLIGYLTMSRSQGTFGFSPAMGRWGAQGDPLTEALKLVPYFEIAAGVALVFGFLTTLAAILSLLVILIGPLIQIMFMLINPGQGIQQNGFPVGVEMSLMNSTRGVTLLIGATVLWLSPTATNPYSVDGLIFPGNSATNPLMAPTTAAQSWEPAPLQPMAQGEVGEADATPMS